MFIRLPLLGHLGVSNRAPLSPTAWKKAHLFIAALFFLCFQTNAQTELIPDTDRRFENATSTFAANSWSTAQPGSARQWQVGTGAGSVTGGTKAAYVGSTTNYNGSNNVSVQHFYRDVAIPSGATNVLFSFYLRRPTVDPGDNFYVYRTTTANTPVSGTVPGAGYTAIYSDNTTTYPAFTLMSSVNLTALAGTTVRLVFTFQSDGSNPHSNPAVDNVSLIYTPPAPTITGYTPSSGCGTTASITIDGTNLSSASAVTIGGTAVSSITSNTATQIVAVVGTGSTGTVSVTTAGGTANGAGTFTVNTTPAAFNVTGGGTYCSTGSGLSVGLSDTESGVNYQLFDDGVPIGAPVAGTGVAISFGLQTSPGTYTVTGTHSVGGCSTVQNGSVDIVMNTAPSISAQPVSVTKCIGASVTFSVTASGTSPTFQWRKNGVNIGGATLSSYTIPSVVAGDAGNFDVVVSVSSCLSVTSSVATLTVVSVPNQYNVSGGGTSCSTGPGINVGLSNSQTNVNYQLYLGASPVGSPVAGTGAAISFGLQNVAGTYTVIATHATGGCTRNQNGSAVITVNTAPSISVNPVSQSKCVGQSVTFSVTAAGTSPSYQWRRNGTNIGGATGSTYTIASVVVGNAGNYDVVVSVAGCTSVTSAVAVLTVGTVPAAYNVTGGGSYCSTGSGVVVGLSNSDAGINYQLFNGASPVGSPVPGTGSAISFGLQTAAGTYTVVATNTVAGCTRNQNGSATVTVITAPSISVNPVSQSKCIGESVSFSVTASGSSPTYQWRKNGSNIGGATAATYSIPAVAGSDAANYDVVVSVTGCTAVTSSAAVLTVNTLPTVFAVTGSGIACPTAVVGLSGSQAGVNYTLSPVGTVRAGTGSAINFGAQVPGTYTATAVNATTGCQASMSGSAILTSAIPVITTQPVDQAVCAGSAVSFTVAASGTGLSYQWKRGTINLTNAGVISGVNTATLTISSATGGLAAADYNCEVTNACGSDISDYVSLTISSPVAAPTAQPTALTFPTIGVTSFIGNFSASANASFYLVVRSNTILPPSNPVDGTTYPVGSAALGVGTYVEYSGTDSSFSSNGLNQGTTYYYWIYAYNASICGTSPRYLTTSPLTGSATTLNNVACGLVTTLYWAGNGSSFAGASGRTSNFNTASNWSTTTPLYLASLSAPTACNNVDIRLASNATISLSANAAVYGLTMLGAGSGIQGFLHTAGRTLTVNGDAYVDVPTGGVYNNSLVGIGELSGAGAGVVDFKANFRIGTNAAPSSSGKASFMLGNINSKIIFRADVLFGRTCIIDAGFTPGTVEFDGIGLQEVLWNNDLYFANFYNVVVGNVNNPIVRHVTGTYTPDNILNNMTVNGSSTLDLATSQWIRDNAGGTFRLNGTSKLVLGNDRSIPSPANGRGLVIPGSNFPGFSTIVLSSGSTVEYDAENTLTQTVYASPTYGNLILTNNTGSGTANKVTTAALTISGTTQVKSGVTFTPAAGIVTNGTFNVNNGGTLVCGTNVVSGTGSFVLNAGGTLNLASPQGISASGATGNITTTTRNFGTAGNFIYNSTGVSVTGNGLPTNMNNLTINNTSGITLFAASANYTVAGTLRLTAGSFVINGNTLIVNSLVRTSGALYGSATSGLTINGTSAPLFFAAGGRILKNLTLNNNATGTILSDLEIPGGSNAGTVTLGAGSVLTTNTRLILRSTATGSARIAEIPVNPSTGVALGTFNGWVQVERYISARRAWRFLSVPTSGSQTIHAAWQEGQAANVTNPAGYGIQITGPNFPNGFDLYTATPSLKTFVPSTGLWTPVTSTNVPFTDGTAYMTFIRGDRTVNAFGQAATSTILRMRGTPLTGKRPVVNVSANQFAAIANPYASAIDFKNISRSNVDDKYYVWDPNLGTLGGYQTFIKNGSGDYEIVLGGGSYGGAGTICNEIQNGQAFMVYSTGASGTVTIEENDKSTGNVSVSRQATSASVSDERMLLRTKLYGVTADGASLVDGVLNQFDDVYSNAVDGEDALKSMSFGENLSIKTAGKLLVVDRKKKVVDTDTIFFNLTSTKAQQYKFEFIPQHMNVEGLAAYFEDSYLQTRTTLNLEDTNTVLFNIVNIPGSYAPNRFRIVFRQQPAPAFTSITATRNGNTVVSVNWQVANEAGMRQYELERSSNGVDFTRILFADPSLNNGAVAAYSYTDMSASPSVNYYRVKASRNCGIDFYSNTVMVASVKGTPVISRVVDYAAETTADKSETGFSVYPNPVVNKTMNIRFSNQPEGTYSLQLRNQLGQVVYQSQVELTGKNGLQKVQLGANLAPGSYQLTIRAETGASTVIQLLIQ